MAKHGTHGARDSEHYGTEKRKHTSIRVSAGALDNLVAFTLIPAAFRVEAVVGLPDRRKYLDLLTASLEA